MLKRLPDSTQSTLLRVFNDLWQSGGFPESWPNATIIPIAKPGKDPPSPKNYQPIALTSCVCKTFKRMVNKRLVWYLEFNNILTEYQSGFHKRRSTTDQLVRLESLFIYFIYFKHLKHIHLKIYKTSYIREALR